VMAVNALDAQGRPQYIHSGTYEELIEAFKLTPAHLLDAIGNRIGKH
jgi:hypothetical protein